MHLVHGDLRLQGEIIIPNQGRRLLLKYGIYKHRTPINPEERFTCLSALQCLIVCGWVVT